MADLIDEQVECPLCMEPLEVDDLTFFPCSCGYQICRFCWHRIRTDENELCPACRKAYSENPADFKPLSQEQVAALKAEKRQRDQQKKQKVNEDRKHLANVRVVQKNLVFVVGLPPRLADPEVLKRHEYFGKYGKIHKVVINPSTAYAGAQGPSASAYVTYVNNNDALKAIQSVNNIMIDGRLIKTSLGTTKYCSNFMKNQPCPKPDCMYLHELGDEEASFTKEEMHQGKHQEYEKKLHDTLINQQNQEEREREANGKLETTIGNKNEINGKHERNNVTSSGSNSSLEEKNSKREKREKRDSSSNNVTNGGNVNGGNAKRNKDTWPSLTTSPTPKSSQKTVKDGKGDIKSKSEKGKSDREKKLTPSDTIPINEEQESFAKSSESSSDSSYYNDAKDKTEEEISSILSLQQQQQNANEETENTTIKSIQNQLHSTFFENSDSSNSADTPFTILNSETQAKGRINSNINSQLPDLLNGTEIDRSGYFNTIGMNFENPSVFGKQNGDGFVDWDEKSIFQPFNKMKLEDALQRDEGLLLDKVLAEQKLDAKNNCSSNMLKFFDFHKNLQNQHYTHKSNGFPIAQEKSYSIFSDYSKPSDVETKQQQQQQQQPQQRMLNSNNFSHPTEQHYQPHLVANNTNKHNTLLSSMYQMSNQQQQQPSVADELGFDPFTETQKALEELIKDEVNRKKTENGELASKRNALNAPPGFSQPSPRNLIAKQAGWNHFNQGLQNHNGMLGINKAPGLGNGGDWTTFDPAIVSYRQFPTHSYGSNSMEHIDPRSTMGMPNPAQNINDFHFNMHQQPNLNFSFDTNNSYGLFAASHARNPMVNSNANNWWANHPSSGYQNNTSNLVSMPPGFPTNMNGNRNN